MKPKSKDIPAGRFKAHCLKLMDEVSRKKAPVTVTKRGKPLVRLVPYVEDPLPLFGCLADSVVIYGDIVGETGENWEAEDDR